VAVEGATFEVSSGEVYGLHGPNGAGKTTLLRMLATIISPTSGRCRVGGLPPEATPEQVRRQVGFLSGNTKLYGRLTPRETLRYFGRLYGLDTPRIERRTQEIAAMLDMRSFMDRRCESLSTGQVQRVSIARCILHEPRVLILDEPTLGLDIMTSRTIFDFIRDASRNGSGVIFSTHYMTEAEHLCDRIALMHRGVVLAEGTLHALCRQTNTANLQDAFLSLVGPAAAAS
jgi:sodium transport system ATP-binding protein